MHQGVTRLQSAGRTRRYFCNRAPKLYPAGSGPRQTMRRSVFEDGSGWCRALGLRRFIVALTCCELKHAFILAAVVPISQASVLAPEGGHNSFFLGLRPTPLCRCCDISLARVEIENRQHRPQNRTAHFAAISGVEKAGKLRPSQSPPLRGRSPTGERGVSAQVLE